MVDKAESGSDRSIKTNNQTNGLPHPSLSHTASSASIGPMLKRAAFASRTSSHSSILSNQLSAHELEGYTGHHYSRPATPVSLFAADSSVIKI
jgi:hypothetical protein